MATVGDIVRTAANEHITPEEIDHILVRSDSYDTLVERIGETSDYSTTHAPAVRETDGQEKLVYVDEDGRKHEVAL